MYTSSSARSTYTGPSTSSRDSSLPPRFRHDRLDYRDYEPCYDRRCERMPERPEWRARSPTPGHYRDTAHKGQRVGQPHGHNHADRGRSLRRPDAQGTREEQLRRTALDTQYTRGPGPTRVIFPPSVILTVKNQQGHPVFPAHLAAKKDTRLGMNAGLSMPGRYTENETIRHPQAVAAAITPVPPMSMSLSEDRMGVWADVQPITTFLEAVNLCWWVHYGNTQAMQYLKWVITQLHDATIRRSLGGVTLLQYQNQVISGYKEVAEGVQVLRSKVANAGHAPGSGITMRNRPTPNTSAADDTPVGAGFVKRTDNFRGSLREVWREPIKGIGQVIFVLEAYARHPGTCAYPSNHHRAISAIAANIPKAHGLSASRQRARGCSAVHMKWPAAGGGSAQPLAYVARRPIPLLAKKGWALSKSSGNKLTTSAKRGSPPPHAQDNGSAMQLYAAQTLRPSLPPTARPPPPKKSRAASKPPFTPKTVPAPPNNRAVPIAVAHHPRPPPRPPNPNQPRQTGCIWDPYHLNVVSPEDGTLGTARARLGKIPPLHTLNPNFAAAARARPPATPPPFPPLRALAPPVLGC
ncbi:hypothetical protein K438DRAFT_1992780 [Mycena galopus ATCC 62051]|nr:hypothetical protein K438DRAFT_1992780 [Mycena galopus ATCC 62051]